jgi:hypothetical protein
MPPRARDLLQIVMTKAPRVYGAGAAMALAIYHGLSIKLLVVPPYVLLWCICLAIGLGIANMIFKTLHTLTPSVQLAAKSWLERKLARRSNRADERKMG